MSFKVSIQNYQIIKKANLEFLPGLNVIVGPSNNGKTSILKAIKALLYTVPGSTPIRVGQTSYAVGISYNGHTVILQKGLKESVYFVDGQKYTKFGTTTPPAVSEALNLKELVLNGNKEQLNFWDQMEYPFLLDKSSVELFRFIIDAGENDQISQVLKSMVSDRQGISKEIDQLQGSLNLLDLDIDNYTNQLKAAKPILEAADKIIELQSKVATLNLLKESKKNLEELTKQKETLSKNYIKSFNTLKIYREFYQAYKVDSDRLNDLKNMFSNLHLLIGDLSDVDYNLIKLSRVKNLPSLNTQNLLRLKDLSNTINNIIEHKNNLRIKPVIKFNYSKKKLDTLNLLKSINDNILDDKDTKNKYKIKIETIKTDIINYKEYKNLFDICPVCGSKLNHKEVHS